MFVIANFFVYLPIVKSFEYEKSKNSDCGTAGDDRFCRL